MTTIGRARRAQHGPLIAFTRASIVGLTFTTAAVHLSLGGLLFTLNAVGYSFLALLMLAPAPIARLRWLVRLALLSFTTATIGGWLLLGARFPLAYIDKALEAVLVGFLLLELWLVDGGPLELISRLRRLPFELLGLVARRGSR
jgi:hypothetical protein